MISKKVQAYIEDHSFCSEYLFKDWEAFLDFLYEEGGRVSSILWWDHCKKNMQHESSGSGGYTDPDDQEWMYAETWLHEDGFEERSLADIQESQICFILNDPPEMVHRSAKCGSIYCFTML